MSDRLSDPCDTCNRWSECNGVDREACPLWAAPKEAPTIIIKCNVLLRDEQMQKLYSELCNQRRQGLILLPPGCELVSEERGYGNIKIIPMEEKEHEYGI